MALDPDPYRTLGLTRGASLDEVKRAYRRLAKINHPDAAGAGALPRFLAIQAAYEQLVGLPGPAGSGSRAGPAARRRPYAADPDRTDATRRAYGGRPREPRAGADPAAGQRSRARRSDTGTPGGGTGSRTPGGTAPRPGPRAGTRRGDAGNATPPGATGRPSSGRTTGGGAAEGTTRTGPARGKATLGSTSYDGADAGPFEPDWGGASWYGTTSGTYWTINPKEYADPRKHGPEYQARARRAAGARDGTPDPEPRAGGAPPGSPTHTTSSWWESTSGPEPEADQPAPEGQTTAFDDSTTNQRRRAEPRRTAPGAIDFDEPAPDPARAAIDLGRALTDAMSGGLRGRAVRAVIGWLPLALGLGWFVGELTGCGRFAATCDPAVAPLTTAGQGIALAVLFLLPEVAAIAAGAALVLLAAATGASLILSATGTAADEESRRSALAALLIVAWLGGLAIALVRRVRSGPRPARPVS